MKRFSHTIWLNRIKPYGTAATLGTLLLVGGLALKPTPKSNADVPQTLAGDNQAELQATAPARMAQRQEQVRQIAPENFDLTQHPVTNQNEKYWRNLLWTTAVVQPQEAFVAATIEQILAMTARPDLSDSQKRTIDAAARVGTQLYLSNPSLYANVGEQFRQTIARSSDPDWVAMSLSGLAQGGLPLNQLQELVAQVKARFPSWGSSVPLRTTILDVTSLIAPRPMPPLSDLLNWTIAPRQLQLYVLCQQDRSVLCQSVLRDQNGTFVRQADGQLWSVPLLLRSIHNLSWNFVRGQSPQGIYRIEGEVPQPDNEYFRAYGQFSLINLFIPFEPGAKQFLPGQPGPFRGSLAAYQRLLPPSWRNYWPAQQSFWAGKMGRSFFRIHGTGESPDFFSGKDKNPDSYNWNPTIGCLSALEIYNEQGQLLQADMPKILNALETVGSKRFTGYLVVVDVPGNTGKPIALDTIEAAIQGKVATTRRTMPLAQASGSSKVQPSPAKPSSQAKLPSTAAPRTITGTVPASSPQTAESGVSTPPSTAPAIVPAPAANTAPTPANGPQPDVNPSVRPLPMAY